jgi:pyruvate ferredoxin oxidoreductase gamma subunit
MNEIRWHARAGQGAKTASQLFALAALRSGRHAQAFPEYGPERRGAPLRAFTRIDDAPIRRHDSVEQPDLVVVLEPSVLQEVDVAEGLAGDGLLLLNAEEAPPGLEGVDVRCVPAGRRSPNLVLAGALAAATGVPLDAVAEAAVELLGRKVPRHEIVEAVRQGYACLEAEEECECLAS